MSTEPKKFGITLTQKSSASKPIIPVAELFGNDGDSDEEIINEKDANKKFHMKYGSNKTRDQRAVEEALAADPNVYEYDSIHDELVSKRNAKTEEQKEADKKREPKYAHKIILATQKRQMEKLMVDERKQAKEREAEGEEFKDKDAFVTGAYKKQIEERERIRRELEEQDRMDDRLKVEDQSFWQANFNRKFLDDLTDEKPLTATVIKVEGQISEQTSSSDQKLLDVKPNAAATVKNEIEEEKRKTNVKRERRKEENKSKTEKEILYERLEKVKEILKQRNNESAIFMARQRYLQRKQNGEIRAPI
uniref:Nuclear speckle splicing regulatory protein 1 N-terminal domain-containing protein n=1 Tax=Panagrolaimus sp. ES5 TaxID=591445 RepID=A0AC34FAW2_9BILA